MSRKTPPIRDEERALWMALAMADMAVYSHKGREALLSHLSSNEIRRRLSQGFGLNLDRFQDRAREIFDAVYAECQKKDDEERARMREIEAILDEANGTAPISR